MNTTNTKPKASASQKSRFYTTNATIQGALCGHIWMPPVKATMPITEDLHARFNRFSVKAGATFRDALLSTLNEKGGDFQNPQFTFDTSLVIERRRNVKPGHSETRIREIPVNELPDCADLVDNETFSYDYNNED